MSAHVHSYLEITYNELCLIYTNELPYLDPFFEHFESRELLEKGSAETHNHVAATHISYAQCQGDVPHLFDI